MGWRVSLTPEAFADLDGITQFIAQDSPAAAGKIRDELIALIFTLDHFPFRGSVLRRRRNLRKLTHRQYLIIYKLDEAADRVMIARIWDGRQNPAKLKLSRQ